MTKHWMKQKHEREQAKVREALQQLIDAQYALQVLEGKWRRHGDKVAKVVAAVTKDVFASHIVKTGE